MRLCPPVKSARPVGPADRGFAFTELVIFAVGFGGLIAPPTGPGGANTRRRCGEVGATPSDSLAIAHVYLRYSRHQPFIVV